MSDEDIIMEFHRRINKRMDSMLMPLPEKVQNERVLLDELQTSIRRDSMYIGADMDQVRELFMLQWEEFSQQ